MPPQTRRHSNRTDLSSVLPGVLTGEGHRKPRTLQTRTTANRRRRKRRSPPSRLEAHYASGSRPVGRHAGSLRRQIAFDAVGTEALTQQGAHTGAPLAYLVSTVANRKRVSRVGRRRIGVHKRRLTVALIQEPLPLTACETRWYQVDGQHRELREPSLGKIVVERAGRALAAKRAAPMVAMLVRILPSARSLRFHIARSMTSRFQAKAGRTTQDSNVSALSKESARHATARAPRRRNGGE